jgi:protein-L-isoaspartate(D-aspartate) O-methyltransferase
MIDFARARKMMVDTQLRTNSITDRRILGAMGELPRENFVPASRRDLAYIDEHIPLGPVGRALPAPAPFARLVQLANVQAGDSVLDVGCGTGYSTAVLAALGARVVGVEPNPELAEAARTNLAALVLSNAEVQPGALDGSGLAGGPFEVVIIESAVAAVPVGLWGQLRDHGRLVAMIGSGMTAVAHVFVKSGGAIERQTGFNAGMPGVVAGTRPDEFVF